MEFYRSLFIAVILFLGYHVWQTYRLEHPPIPMHPANTEFAGDPPALGVITPDNLAPASRTAPAAPVVIQNRYITVETDTMHVQIDRVGGDVVHTALLQYPLSKADPQPYPLLQNDGTQADRYRVAQTDILSSHLTRNRQAGRLIWEVEKSEQKGVLGPDDKQLRVALRYQDKEQGINLLKVFIFERGSHLITVRYILNHSGLQPVSYRVWAQFKQAIPTQKSAGFLGINTFAGGVFSAPDHRFEKIHLDKLGTQPDKRDDVMDGWLASVEQHFLGAWIPEPKVAYQYQARLLPDQSAALSLISPVITLETNQTREETLQLYVGPQQVNVLKTLAPGLERTVDYGWFWPISTLLFTVLSTIHGGINNWGWSIVLITILIKALFFQLSAKSYRAMAQMKKLQPEIERIKEKFEGNREKMGEALMKLYQEKRVNPLGGCLPIVVQIPVFIALYSVLIASVELRMAPFVGWIQDLSAPDPYFVLPLLMGASMLLQQRLTPAPPDPMQAKVMMFLPVVFTALFLYFPAGLVLYWVVNNILTLLQQWLIMRRAA